MTTKRAKARSNSRSQLDKNLARSLTPRIARVLRQERNAILAATRGTTTVSAWETAAVEAITDVRWIAPLVTFWTSPPMLAIWEATQTELGTDHDLPPAVQQRLTRYATEHGRSIADTNRTRIRRMVRDVVDVLESKGYESKDPPFREFRSSMRTAVAETYADLVHDKASRLAWTETLQATETVRYESANESAKRSTARRLRKVWFTVGDSRVRATHSAVNGTSRFVDNRGRGGAQGVFIVGGARLRYPRDPSGPPGEVINCRCFLEYRWVKPTR